MVATAPWTVEFQEVVIPDPSEDDVVIEVTHSWISNGTEGSFVRGERISGDTPWVEGNPQPFPIVTGYQKVGRVEWVGADVTGLAKGDIVFATTSKIKGMHFSQGGHVSPAVTPWQEVWKVPPGLDPESVSCLVLAQVGYNCGTAAPVNPGDRAVVVGDGLVGHWSAQTLKHRGASVMIVGKYDERLACYSPGADDRRVNINRDDFSTALSQWSPDGINVLIDTVGSVAFMESAYPSMKRFGHLVSAGFHGNRGLIDIQRMRLRELSLQAPSGWTRDRMNRTLELLAAGALSTSHLITHRFPVNHAADAFDLILSRREHALGVVLIW